MSDPYILAVVSGKGGVGKTMLAVACATELARASKTLLVDLDFFNRGLTGLFGLAAARAPRLPLDAPRNLVRTADGSDWAVAQVRQNLYVLSYGDVDKASSTELESVPMADLAGRLKDYIAYACRVSGCDAVILDCIGGPDLTSFAACMVAKHAILVSEPDKITLYGTLNFLRTMGAVIPDDQRPDIRLVFNKVIPAFTARFLLRFYGRLLAEEFGGRDLLAIYPMEAHLTKAFEKTPYLTIAYPTSQLAVQTRLLLFELAGQEAPQLLAPSFRKPSRLTRYFHRYNLGLWPRFLEADFVLRAIAVVGIVVIALPQFLVASGNVLPPAWIESIKKVENYRISPSEKLDDVIMLVSLIWLLLAIAMKWTRDVDIFATTCMKTRRLFAAAGSALILSAFYFGLGIGAGSLTHDMMRPFHTLIIAQSALAIGLMLWAILPLLHARRGLLAIRFEKSKLEGALRLGLSLGVPALGYFIGLHLD